MAPLTLTQHTAKAGAHRTAYLASGPEDGAPIIFVHGWPELSISWRHQLPVFGALGFRAVAPDMRGYGGSTVYPSHEDYAQERVVGDMLALLDSLEREQAVWVGHDWGSATVWSLASHHPERCHAVANLCVPYYTLERGLDAILPLVDRDLYPTEIYPAGQWEYMRFYEENFERARTLFEANAYDTMKLFLRKGDPAGRGQPAITAPVRNDNGWFGGVAAVPDLPRDADVVSHEDLCAYAAALDRNGFFGPGSYYMNHAANAAYAATASNDGYLDMPTLFVAAEYDYVCETTTSRLAEPMRQYCRKLTEESLPAGHWMAQEKPCAVNAALTRWLAANGLL